MKLFKLSQTENDGYETYDSIIVAAPDEVAARKIHPCPYYNYWEEPSGVWCTTPENVTVEYIGEAKEGLEQGVILSSFNAG